MSSPTQRTLKRLRDEGYIAGVVERHNVYSHTKNDLFGFVDVLAVKPGSTVAVQATSGSNAAARVTKILEERENEAKTCLLAGWTIQIWGWRKYAKPIDRKFWRPHVTSIILTANGLEAV